MHPTPPDLPFVGDSLLTQDLDSAIQDFLAPSEASRISLAGYDFPQEPFGPKGIDQTSPQEIAAVDDAKVSVATTFHLGFTHEGQAADVILVSSDLVNFCVVSQTLLEKSANMFASLLSTPHDAVVVVPLAANVLNVLLHAIYSLSLAMYAPSSADIALAVAAMSTYGIYPTKLIVPDSTLFQVIVHNAIATPFECYAIAASAKLEELAIAVSPYTLSKSLSELADDLVQQIGPVYLKRLFFLHLGRVEALKRLLFPPPEPHLPTDKCSSVDQRQLARAWILAVCYLTWEARPDLSVPSIEAVLRPIKQQQSCTDCREYLDQRIKKLLVDWSLVKRTI